MSLYGYKKKHKPALWTEVFKAKLDPTEAAAPKGKAVGKALPRKRRPATEHTKARRREERLYAAEAREFVRAAADAGGTCPVVAAIPELRDGRKYGWPISGRLNEVHHMRGRRGDLLRDRRFWLAVSKQGHRWIHSHPAEARARGWLAPVGQWEVSP